MNDRQKAAAKRFDKAWLIDTNMQGEPILYTRKGNRPTVDEFVLDIDGRATKTGEYSFTKELEKEIDKFRL